MQTEPSCQALQNILHLSNIIFAKSYLHVQSLSECFTGVLTKINSPRDVSDSKYKNANEHQKQTNKLIT